MSYKRIIFQLISKELMPNVILHHYLDPKPDDLTVFLPTSATESSVKVLREVLGIGDSSGHDQLSQLRSPSVTLVIEALDWKKIYDLVEKETTQLRSENPEAELILNWTTGTKINADAVKAVIEHVGGKHYYCNSENKKIIQFSRGKFVGESPYPELDLSLDEIVKINSNGDFKIKQTTSEPENVDNKCKEYQKFIEHLESQAGGTTLLVKLNNKVRSFYEKLYNHTKTPVMDPKDTEVASYKIQHSYQNQIITFKITDTKKRVWFELNGKKDHLKPIMVYMNGGWFEDRCVERIKGVFNNIHSNVMFVAADNSANRQNNKEKDVLNEIDIIALDENLRPYVFECKSGYIIPTDVDKFFSTKDSYFGRNATLALISYFPISNKESLEKLKSKKISVIQYSEFENLNTEQRKKFFLDRLNSTPHL